MSISTLKWPELETIAPSFMAAKCCLRDDVLVAGDGAEEVADLGGFSHRHHTEAVHDRFERVQRVHFGDNDLRAHAARAHGQAAAAPAVAGDDELTPASRTLVARMMPSIVLLARAIAVVEKVLGLGVVDGDDRITQHAVLRHSAQADDAGRGFFRAADDVGDHIRALGVDDADHVRAVVHRDVRLVVQRCHDVRVIGLVVLAFDGEGRNAVVADQARGDIVLRGQRVGSAQGHVGAPSRSAIIKFAVSAVTCRHADMRIPFNGWFLMNSLRMICKTFIDWLAHSMRFLPRSAVSKFLTSLVIDVVAIFLLWRAVANKEVASSLVLEIICALLPGSQFGFF